MLKEVDGFILTETPYGESSKIINVLTKEFGIIGIIAKGANSLKSKNRVATLKLTYAKFNIYYKENKLSTLVSADIINPLKNIRSDIFLISYLTYLAELTYQVVKQSNAKDIVKNITINNHLEAVRELVQRDKNYACVVMWSLFNEPDAASSDDCIPYFEKVFNLCKELDVQKRPRSFAHIIASNPKHSKVSYLCDVIMLNRYYGWYLMGGAELEDAMIALDAELSEWDKIGKPVMFTEYGTDNYLGLTKIPAVMWTENYQVEYLEKYHEVFDRHDSIMGEQVWNFADFQTTEGIIRADGNKKGIFTRDRRPKMAAFELRRRWLSLPNDYKGK